VREKQRTDQFLEKEQHRGLMLTQNRGTKVQNGGAQKFYHPCIILLL
jgi:hypothetical protein